MLLLGLAFGFAYFDRMAMTFLSPYVVKDLGLNNTQVGALGSGLSVTWALGAYLIGRWSDAVGARKPFLLAFMVIFSFCSVLSGLAAELRHAVRQPGGDGRGRRAVPADLPGDHRRRQRREPPGLNVGIVQNFFGSLIGTALAPIVLVGIADTGAGVMHFTSPGIPGLILALLIWQFIHEPPPSPGAADHARRRRCCLSACSPTATWRCAR